MEKEFVRVKKLKARRENGKDCSARANRKMPSSSREKENKQKLDDDGRRAWVVLPEERGNYNDYFQEASRRYFRLQACFHGVEKGYS